MYKLNEIQELIKLIDESNLSEVKIKNGEQKITIKKEVTSLQPALVQTLVAPPVIESVAVSSAPLTKEAPAEETVRQDSKQEAVNIHEIKSPMVGTFYAAAAPDAPDFVSVGDQVTEKTVVCIVEAMKLMNEIEAETKGRVVEVCVENGQLVEYGQVLFRISKE